MTIPRFALPLVLALALALPGCGGGKEDAAAKIADMSTPMEGRSVSKADQVRGAWMAVSDGNLDGIEFLKDSRAILSLTRGVGALTVSYSLLDDGRISLVNPSGETTVVGATVSGETLELSPEQSHLVSRQRFQRVPKGQSLTEAIRAHEERMLARMERRAEALQAVLSRGDAVLTPEDGAPVEWVVALEFDGPGGELSGRAVFQERERSDALSPVRVLPVRGQAQPGSPRDDTLRVRLDLGPASEPEGQERVAGRVELIVRGDLDKPEITGTAHLSQLWPQPVPVTLHGDRARHGAVAARLAEQRAAIAAEIDAMRAFLGARTALSGHRTSTAGQPREPVALMIEYNPAARQYDARITASGRTDQAGVAAVQTLLGRAALYVATPWGEQWRLQRAGDDGLLQGPWRPSARADFLTHGAVELTIDRRWTEGEVAAERAAVERFLTEDLASPQRFTGFVERRHGAVNAARWPVSVEFQSDGSGGLTGSAWIVSHAGGATLQGRLTGRSATLTAEAALPASADPRRVANQRWELELTGLDPLPAFEGRLSANPGGGGPVVLTQVTPESAGRDRDRLVRALTSARYAMRTADTSSVRDEQVFFVFDDVDAPSGRVSGRLLGDGSKWRNAPPGLFDGEIVDDHGVPVLRLTVRGAPDPARGNGDAPAPFTLDLCAFDGEDGVVRLTGSTPPGPGNQDWVTLDPIPEDAAIPMDPARAVRLAALRMGASATPARFAKPGPGDEMLVVVSITERDLAGRLHHADGRYAHGDSVEAAAVHAGVATPGEVVILRLAFHEPFTEPVEAHERNGVTTRKANFRPDNQTPTFRVERVAAE